MAAASAGTDSSGLRTDRGAFDAFDSFGALAPFGAFGAFGDLISLPAQDFGHNTICVQRNRAIVLPPAVTVASHT